MKETTVMVFLHFALNLLLLIPLVVTSKIHIEISYLVYS